MTHTDTLKIFPYFFSVRTRTEVDVEIYAWCEDRFGKYRPEKACTRPFRWCTGFKGYYFKREQDYILTALRWT